MLSSFRMHHIVKFFHVYEREKGPLDYAMSLYFRANKACGSKDRAVISECVYTLVRWKKLYDAYLPKEKRNWEGRLSIYMDQPEAKKSLPLDVRVSCPTEFFEELVSDFGKERAGELALILNEKAPVSIRVNRGKISREELFKLFQEKGFKVSLAEESPLGIIFHEKTNFFSLEEFKKGYFEVQDEASQLAADLVVPKAGGRILDFCAGSGGKTLAFAYKTEGKGQIYLHDIRKKALFEAKKRLKRAGVQNGQIIHADEKEKLSKLKKKMDIVFVDAPCSGTGTYRRNPDMKWRFSKEGLLELVGMQRMIFEQALSYVKPGGTIIYATCSLLKKENQEQVAHFLDHYPIKEDGELFQSLPDRGKKDGFFAVCFRKSDTV